MVTNAFVIQLYNFIHAIMISVITVSKQETYAQIFPMAPIVTTNGAIGLYEGNVQNA